MRVWDGLDLLRHAASSAVTLLLPRAHLDAVRVGLLIYGIPPFDGPCPLPLRPPLTRKARVTQVNPLPVRWPVSYGETFVTKRPSRLAILPVGYADGYPRRLSSCGAVLLHGRRCPILGRVCMDQCVVDVTDLPHISVGEEAVLVGEQDLTAHVDFTSIRAAAEAEGMTTIGWLDQTYFLVGLLPSIADPDSALRTPQLKTLMLPGGLGSTHTVLILGKGVGAPALKGCSFTMRVT